MSFGIRICLIFPLASNGNLREQLSHCAAALHTPGSDVVVVKATTQGLKQGVAGNGNVHVPCPPDETCNG